VPCLPTRGVDDRGADLAAHPGGSLVWRVVLQLEHVTVTPDDVGSFAPGGWPTPRPIVTTLKPVPVFDAELLLPPSLRPWVMDEAGRMPCPPDFVAVAAVVALSSVIGARCAIKPKAKDNWLVVPNLWGGIVGSPSSKKTPATSAALRAMDRLTAAARKDHEAAMADFEAVEMVHEARRDAIHGRVKSAAKGGGKGETEASLESITKELQAHNRGAPAPPILRRYKTNDTTVEKLGELLRDNPAGLLVVRDELVGLIETWDREGREGDRAFFLEAWNGNQGFDTDRIGRGNVHIKNVCVSILGGIQPDRLIRYLEAATRGYANDGMLQRFQLLVYPDPPEWEWRDRTPDAAAARAAMEVFERLANLDPVEVGAAPADDLNKFPYFRFSPAAQEVFIEWSMDLHRERLQGEVDPIVHEHLSKYNKLFPALALIFHLVSGGGAEVDEESARRAAAWCEYLEAHARRCYGLVKDDGRRAAQSLAERLKRGDLQDGFTARDVRRNQWRDLTKDEAIQAALDWLEDEHWVRGEEADAGPRGGRPTRRYRINPAVLLKSKG